MVARSFLRSRCDSVRPRRIVQHLQGFGLGPLVGRLVEERFIRRKRNRQRHKCEDAKAVKSDLTQLGKKEDERMGTTPYAHAIRSHHKRQAWAGQQTAIRQGRLDESTVALVSGAFRVLRMAVR